ncbi:unnamed protein product [Prunus armeniaca]|uniref:FAR1 domain-containing protein n=1 Tax=Prunus armeniaca TaxID=36596 RepID=A0A6J5VYW8_PRUAR|nr:unnamed protein product [Prunus armeniaca]CAB4294406.1 unnamed protein product [Prunus armeniaca]
MVTSGLNYKNCEMECEGQATLEVSSKLKPKLGPEFDCCDDVFNFYNIYVAKAGFGIRCSTTRTCTLTGEVTRKEYVCCKQGYSLTSTVSRFNEEHNHDMTTADKVHLLRSHRNLTGAWVKRGLGMM